MLSQFTRQRILKEAEARALEKSGAQVEVKETLPESRLEVAEEIPADVESKAKKTDAEKLKKKKDKEV